MPFGISPLSQNPLGGQGNDSAQQQAPVSVSVSTSQSQTTVSYFGIVVGYVNTSQGTQTATGYSAYAVSCSVATSQGQHAYLQSNAVDAVVASSQGMQSAIMASLPVRTAVVNSGQGQYAKITAKLNLPISSVNTYQGKQSTSVHIAVPLHATITTRQSQYVVGSGFVAGAILDVGPIQVELYKLAPDTRVELFQIDATSIGGSIYYFTTTKCTDPIVWGGEQYPYAGVSASGFELNAKGSLPTPTLTVSNPNSILRGLAITLGDLLGAKVTRIRTSYRFTDNGGTPDTNAHLPLDVYLIEQKTSHNKLTISWQLSAILDKQGRTLPKRQILRDTCLHTYRKWNYVTGQFDYTNVTCPYVGTNYFVLDGTQTPDATKDMCGKRVSDCKQRFGNDGLLPTRAFPGVMTGMRG